MNGLVPMFTSVAYVQVGFLPPDLKSGGGTDEVNTMRRIVCLSMCFSVDDSE